MFVQKRPVTVRKLVEKHEKCVLCNDLSALHRCIIHQKIEVGYPFQFRKKKRQNLNQNFPNKLSQI